MTMINSVLGPLDTAALGFTLMHEHVAGAAPGILQNYPELLGDGFMERIVAGLTKAREGGIDTIIDASTFDLGRDVSLLAEASRRSGGNIIATSGWFHDPDRFMGDWSADQFARLFVREVREGIAGTGIRAGILKSATDVGGVTPGGEIMLRAVARAHHETGVPIMLHSYAPGQVGRQQLAVLQEEGVDMGRVKVDHSLDTTDVAYLTWLLEQGCYLGMDRYPGNLTSPLARTKTLKALIDAGYKDRLCVSHDWSLARHVAKDSPIGSPAKRKKRNPHDYLYIKKVVFPQLLEMGVSEEIIGSLLVDAPRNFFEGV